MKDTKARSQYSLDLSGEQPIMLPAQRKEKEKIKPAWFLIGSAGSIGFAITVPLLICIGIGIFIDNQFHTKPTGVLGGLIIGIIVSVLNLVKTVQDILNQASHS